MTRRIAVVDTNVVVSGLIVADESSPPARIVEAMLKARIPFLLSIDLLAEYRAVLLRPAISLRHGLTPEEIDVLLGDLALHAAIDEPRPTRGPITDAGDRHLRDLLAGGRQADLVTGDRRLRESPPPGIRAISPREFVDSRRL